jgi:O-antigen/teichoic acid export membrane protein
VAIFLLPAGINEINMGIFGAMMKIATFMMLFIQAFRFAAEPFFFSGEGDFKQKMARVLRYFVMVQSLIFLGLVCFTELLQASHFIDEKYWEGWHIVPILLFANLLLGINFNLNIWYKLKDKTHMGAYISFFGLAFTVTANLILVPGWGYTGAAWATLISYGAMTLFSFYLNQKYDRTQYPVGPILRNLGVAAGLAWLSFYYFDAAWLPGLLIFSSFLAFLALVEGKGLLQTLRK